MNLKENLSRRNIWMRLVFMIVMGVAYGVAEAVAFAVVVFQFLSSLFTGTHNERLARFGRNLARYFQQITVFMTFATEEKPFPFGPWPDEPHDEPPLEEEPPPEDEPVTPDDEPEKTANVTENEAEAEPKKPSSRKSAAKPKSRSGRKTDS